MTVRCYVSRPGRRRAKMYKFVSVPRIGEAITLPGYFDEFTVEAIEHIGRECEDSSRPVARIRLCSLTPDETHHPIGFLPLKGDTP